MFLDYGTQVSPTPISLSIGTIKKPKLIDISEITFERCSVRTGKAIYASDARPYTTPYVKRRLPDDSYKYGIITHPQQVGGLPQYIGTPYIDSDCDGMPDEWEQRYGLDPHDAKDATSDCNGDGYTNIEKYINGIDPTTKIDWSNPANNYDTLHEKDKLN